MAKFEIHGTFNVSERGTAFLGIVLESIINSGDHIRFDFKGKRLDRRIKELEFVRSENQEHIGIMLGSPNKSEDSDLFRDWEPNKTIGITSKH